MEILKYCILMGDLQKLKQLTSSSSLTYSILKEKDFSFPDQDSSLLLALSDSLLTVFPSLDLIKFLVEEIGVDVNKCNVYGISPLVQSTLHRNADITEYLLSRGADPCDYLHSSDERNILFWLKNDGDTVYENRVLEAIAKIKDKKRGSGKRICLR